MLLTVGHPIAKDGVQSDDAALLFVVAILARVDLTTLHSTGRLLVFHIIPRTEIMVYGIAVALAFVANLVVAFRAIGLPVAPYVAGSRQNFDLTIPAIIAIVDDITILNASGGFVGFHRLVTAKGIDLITRLLLFCTAHGAVTNERTGVGPVSRRGNLPVTPFVALVCHFVASCTLNFVLFVSVLLNRAIKVVAEGGNRLFVHNRIATVADIDFEALGSAGCLSRRDFIQVVSGTVLAVVLQLGNLFCFSVLGVTFASVSHDTRCVLGGRFGYFSFVPIVTQGLIGRVIQHSTAYGTLFLQVAFALTGWRFSCCLGIMVLVLGLTAPATLTSVVTVGFLPTAPLVSQLGKGIVVENCLTVRAPISSRTFFRTGWLFGYLILALVVAVLINLNAFCILCGAIRGFSLLVLYRGLLRHDGGGGRLALVILGLHGGAGLLALIALVAAVGVHGGAGLLALIALVAAVGVHGGAGLLALIALVAALGLRRGAGGLHRFGCLLRLGGLHRLGFRRRIRGVILSDRYIGCVWCALRCKSGGTSHADAHRQGERQRQ
ncbi:MAG: hypothetical protein HFF49_13875 [Lawsonibacter sp.]|nr:hypothetical protein [Lawsonibacter sp.]